MELVKDNKLKRNNYNFNMNQEMKDGFNNLMREKFIFLCWIIFILILGQITLICDIVDILLGDFHRLHEVLMNNFMSGSMYSFATACLGSNLLSFNLELQKESVLNRTFKNYMNIIGFILIILMMMGWFSLYKYNNITTRQIIFQIVMYIISTYMSGCLLGVQIGEEDFKEIQDKNIIDVIDKSTHTEIIKTNEGDIQI